jgi:hypothetical protein
LACAALALWAGRGVLDVVPGAAGPVRVALLPPVAWLVVAIVALMAIGIAFGRTRRDSDVALPLVALIVLALPYLPWLPDRLPVLRAGAGPGRDVMWLVVLWLTIARAAAGRIPAVKRGAAAIFLASALIFGAAAWRMAGAGISPDGDEPHYLVITQSLLRDHDLKIENNHQRGDYREDFSATLRPDSHTRGLDGQIYSVHPIGLPVLALPAFAIGGYPAVIAMLVLMAALAAAIGWQWMRDLSGSSAAATFGWASVALTAPFLFNSFTVYPEIPAALAVMIALAWRPSSRTPAMFLARGLAIAALPWLSTKYLPMAAVIGALWIYRLRFKIGRESLALAVPPLVSLTAWFAFFYLIWGTFAPSAPYGSQDPMTLRNLAHGLPGLLFDQEYGVVFVAPVLALAVLGLAAMWRKGSDRRQSAVELTAVFGALIVTVGAFHVWWGGTASPGRPVASAVMLFGGPIALFYAGASRRARVTAHALLALSLAIAVVLVSAENGALLRNSRDGSAAIVEWISPVAPVAAAFPSFIAGGLARAFARTAAWLALGAIVIGLIRFRKPAGDGAFALTTIGAALVGGVVLVSAFAGAAVPDIGARARMPLLDSFDASRRPLAIVFDPFSRVEPDALVGRASFTARAGQRTANQPVDLLWKARFALPAGEYLVDFTRPSAEPASSMSLQVGRGRPIDTWPVTGTSTQHRFTLPVDASLVGFVAPPEIAASGGELRLTPARVVSAGDRPSRPPVLSTYKYGPLTVYFHSAGVAGDSSGFWTLGHAVTQLTIAAEPSTSVALLNIRCGPIANHLRLATESWRAELDVAAGAMQASLVPLKRTGEYNIAALDIDVANAFVPAEADKASTDRRKLGCWIEPAAAIK